jgi:hypothetical protein
LLKYDKQLGFISPACKQANDVTIDDKNYYKMIFPTLIHEIFISLSDAIVLLTIALFSSPFVYGHSKSTAIRGAILDLSANRRGSELITGSTAHEKNSYQCSPERRNSGCDGRWPATLRSGHRNTLPRTEKGQRLQG